MWYVDNYLTGRIVHRAMTKAECVEWIKVNGLRVLKVREGEKIIRVW